MVKTIKPKKKASLKPYIAMNTDLTKKQKMVLEKTSLSWSILTFLVKPQKMWENIDILNLSQQKEKQNI